MKSSKVMMAMGILIFPLFCRMAAGQTTTNDKSYLQDPESLIRELYKTVSAKAGEAQPDWEKVRNMFHEKANVSLRVNRNLYNIFDTDGFINDFKNFYNEPRVRTNGFAETILSLKKITTGNIAFIMTQYEARIFNGPFNQGIDSWQLINRDGRWWIFSITNEVVDRNTPVPDILK